MYLRIKSFYWSIQSKKLNIFRTSAINTKSVYSFIQYQAQKNIIVYYLFHFQCSRCQSNGLALHIFAHATILQLLPKQHNGFLYYCWVSKYTALQEGLSTVIHCVLIFRHFCHFMSPTSRTFSPYLTRTRKVQNNHADFINQTKTYQILGQSKTFSPE